MLDRLGDTIRESVSSLIAHGLLFFSNLGRLIIFAAWICVTVLAIGWLQRSEAEAVPGGKEVFVSGFCATFFFLVPRAKFYIAKIRETGQEMSVCCTKPRHDTLR